MPNNNNSKIKSILVKGFGFIIFIIILIALAWLNMIQQQQAKIEKILDEQSETRSIFTMRDVAYRRALILHRMALLKDVFDRDEEYLRFREMAVDFIKARDSFLESMKDGAFPEELSIWEQVAPDIRKGSRVQAAAAEYLLNDESEKANQLLINEVVPTQNRVMSQLTELLERQRKAAETTAEEIAKQNQSGILIMSLLATLAITWAVFIGSRTIRRTSRVEQSLKEAHQKAQQADQSKSQFLANMSHEIRTPLTAIIGYSETLIEDKQSGSDWEKYVSSIIKNSKHLHQLINDILDISKIEANQLSVEKLPISLCELMTEIESLMGEKARKKGLQFNTDCQLPIPKTIFSDPTRIKQILINLCGNAIKFTARGNVTLRLSYSLQDNKVMFNVEDTGIGMTQEQTTELFKPFKQADTSTTRKFGGTGLGLYISKQLSERLGGDLLFDSNVGVGSRFTVTIDAGEEAKDDWITTPDEINPYAQSSRLTTRIPALYGKVLLAEDSPDNQALISLHIKKTGADVKVVDNGKQAVDTALSEPFDLILMDMQMPVMGGIEAIRLLREKGCSIPIAMLTANAMKEDVEQSEQAGANNFLTKPIDRKAFYATLEEFLSPAYEEINPMSKMEDNPELDDMRDLIEMYINQLPETCYRLERYMDAKEWEGVKEEIHKLKGTGSAFGFPDITRQCIDIEGELIKKNLEQTRDLVLHLCKYCMKIANDYASPHS